MPTLLSILLTMKTWKTKRKIHIRENSTEELEQMQSLCKRAVSPPDWYVHAWSSSCGRKMRRKSWDNTDRENETGVKGAKEVVRWDWNRLENSGRRQQLTGCWQKKPTKVVTISQPLLLWQQCLSLTCCRETTHYCRQLQC